MNNPLLQIIAIILTFAIGDYSDLIEQDTGRNIENCEVETKHN
mgnify:CR=1 FL=1